MRNLPAPSPETTWVGLIDSLRDNWGSSRDVVHRPMLTLILLARAQHGHSNEVRFNDIDECFRNAIREFAPSRDPSGLEYPFWYLRKNGFWEVEGAEKLPRVKSKDRPTRPGLVKHNPAGHVPEHLWKELTSTSGLIEGLACRIMDEFWPDRPRAALAASLGLTVRERPAAVSQP